MDVLLRYFCAVMFSYCYRPTIEPFRFVVTGQFCHNYISLPVHVVQEWNQSRTRVS